ncbi:hypothetical protein [Variovorax sp. DT-64]|uniref:hypothetical protein n=1 Tax=Variovorax sp. DT-64 TaxID=3396160 RepID=UPI003F1C47D2
MSDSSGYEKGNETRARDGAPHGPQAAILNEPNQRNRLSAAARRVRHRVAHFDSGEEPLGREILDFFPSLSSSS